MTGVIAGIVKDGKIIPNSPLPEGAAVEIRLRSDKLQFTPEEQAEFAAWNRASDQALTLVERLAQEGASVEIRVCEPADEEERALQEELEAWRMTAANSLEMVERMLEETDTDEKG